MRKASPLGLILILPLAALFVLAGEGAVGYQLESQFQFGTSTRDRGADIVVDSSGNILVTGRVHADDPGGIDADTFVRKYTSMGILDWHVEFGETFRSVSASVATTGGDVYVAGSATGSLSGQPFEGVADAYLRRYDSSGTEVWTRMFGTGQHDSASEVCIDPAGTFLFVVGTTEAGLTGEGPFGGRDAFVRKYDLSGSEIWTHRSAR